MESIGERIRKVRHELGFNQSQFAAQLGVSNGYLSELEEDGTKPGYKILIGLLEKFSVDINWVLDGRGTMFIRRLSFDPDSLPPELLEMARYFQIPDFRAFMLTEYKKTLRILREEITALDQAGN